MPKNKYRVELLSPAQRELELIGLYYFETAGTSVARKITGDILNSLSLLESNPNIGVDCASKPLKLPGYRMLISGKYICVYRLIGTTVSVYHIADGRSDYPRLMSGLV